MYNIFSGGCKSGQYQCGDGNCVNKNQICDGKYDCVDWADERDCSKFWYYSIYLGGKILKIRAIFCMYIFLDLCEDNQFQCEAGLCIPKFQRCDGYDHCPDGTDELDCPSNLEKLY